MGEIELYRKKLVKLNFHDFCVDGNYIIFYHLVTVKNYACGLSGKVAMRLTWEFMDFTISGVVIETESLPEIRGISDWQPRKRFFPKIPLAYIVYNLMVPPARTDGTGPPHRYGPGIGGIDARLA